MSESGCPDDTELAALARGTIAAERGAVLRDHIGDCEACRAVVAAEAAAEPDPRTAEDAGRPESRYTLERLIATGGMGEVFLARDNVLDRDVAIKVLREEATATDSVARSRRRLLREAQALARLAHPNIVAVFDHGVLDGRAFLAMEYVRGSTLRQWLAAEPRSPREITRMLLQAGRGLGAAHEIGIVHRDFKPDNVLVGEDGRARVTDFGLAHAAPSDAKTSAASADPTVTVEGTVSGTPAYMAPEQRAGEPVSEKADQYAFCVTLHEALFGNRPRGTSVHADSPTALIRGLSEQPDARFPSMKDLLAALDEGAAAPIAEKRRPLAMLGSALTVVALVAGGALLYARHAASAPAGLHGPCSSTSSCAAPLVCRFADGNSCGAGDAPGTCGWPVDGCNAKSPKACGCNGATFDNQCDANHEGVAASYRGACIKCTSAIPCAPLATANGKTPAYCHIGVAASEGVCQPRPSACLAGGASSCGRDGHTYESACEARRAGTDVERAGACATTTARPVAAGGIAFGAPDEQGMDARPLIALSEWIEREKLPIFSLLVSRNGVVVYELYTSSLTRQHAHYLMGVTSAVTSALMGVAIDRHLVAGAEASVADALPKEVFPDEATRERFRPITIRDVLAMSALDAPVPPHDTSAPARARQQAFLQSTNRLKFALTQEPLARPGVVSSFTDVTPLIAIGILDYATKNTALEFAEESLFRPMGFESYEWMHEDATGFDNGAYGLRLRPIDMQKLGLLYLRQGAWEERRLLSSDWTLRSFTPWIKSSPGLAEPNYGSYWWAGDFGQSGRSGWIAHFAQGWKGQKIVVFPEQGLVVTMTGIFEPPLDDAATFRTIMHDYITPSVEGTANAPSRPDPHARAALGDLNERIRNAPLTLKRAPEPRMVPSIEPKEKHHEFRPD